MTTAGALQILVAEKAYPRIEDGLRERLPDVEALLWRADGSITDTGGRALPADAVTPRAAWISADLLGPGGALNAFADTLATLPSVEWLQTANAGLDHPAYARLARNGIRFSKSGAQSIPIAEFVLAYALEQVQDLAFRRAAQADGEWRSHRFGELWHSTWLIVGYGHIGRNVAKRAKAFDAQTIVVRQSAQADEFADHVTSLDELHAHLPRADYVVLACPATDATRGLVNAEFLAAMKPEALLLNVARGALVDEAALLASLDAGRPARAVLDVFRTEPLPADSPLWTHPRVTVTAHISNAGSGTRPRGDTLFLSNLERFARGDTPLDIAGV